MQDVSKNGSEMEYLEWTRIITEALASVLLFGQYFKYRRITRICKKHTIPCRWSFTMSIMCLVLALAFTFIVVMYIFKYNLYLTFLVVGLIFGGAMHTLKIYT